MTRSQNHLVQLFPVAFSIVTLLIIMALIPFTIAFQGRADEVNLEPKNILISDVSANSFTVTFVTSNPAIGSLSYGLGTNLSQYALDSLDTKKSYTHQVTAKSLTPGKTYSFIIGTDNTAWGSTRGLFEVPLPPASTKPPVPPKVVTGSLPAGDYSDAVLVLQSDQKNLSARPDKDGNFLFTWTNFVDSQGNYLDNLAVSPKVVVFEPGKEPTSFVVDATKRDNSPKVATPEKAPVGETAEPIAKPAPSVSWWDSFLNFLSSLFGNKN